MLGVMSLLMIKLWLFVSPCEGYSVLDMMLGFIKTPCY